MRAEVVGIVELGDFGVVVVAEHEVAADLKFNFSAFGAAEVEAGAASAADRVEVDAHAVRIGLRGVPPVELDLHGNRMGMVVAQLLVDAGGKQQENCK